MNVCTGPCFSVDCCVLNAGGEEFHGGVVIFGGRHKMENELGECATDDGCFIHAFCVEREEKFRNRGCGVLEVFELVSVVAHIITVAQ
jgi:hypothetical protein